MNNVVPRPRPKGTVCDCGCTRFKQISIYKPLRCTKIVYARCKNPACNARVKFKITLEYVRHDES
jgi:hypothetical protein